MTSTLCHGCKHYDWWNSCDGFKDDDAYRSIYVPDIVKTCPFYSPYYSLLNFGKWIANQFRLLTGHGFECCEGNRNEG